MCLDQVLDGDDDNTHFDIFDNILTHCDLLLFLFGAYRPTRDLFTHMETSPLPVKGCKF